MGKSTTEIEDIINSGQEQSSSSRFCRVELLEVEAARLKSRHVHMLVKILLIN